MSTKKKKSFNRKGQPWAGKVKMSDIAKIKADIIAFVENELLKENMETK